MCGNVDLHGILIGCTINLVAVSLEAISFMKHIKD